MLKKLLFFVLFLFFAVLFLPAQSRSTSIITFQFQTVKNMQNNLSKETTLLQDLKAIIINQIQLSATLQTQITELKQVIQTDSILLDKLNNVNSKLDGDYKAEVRKNKILSISLGTVIPITFVCAIGAGLAIGFTCSKYIK